MLTLARLQLAILFYTRLPCRVCEDYEQLPQATLCLPLIGWLIGGSSALAFYLAALLWSKVTAVIIALLVGILLTGGLHEDGFADVCDGFGASWDKARILEIMKDSHSGVYALLGLGLLMTLKISVLNELPSTIIPWALLAGHSVSRFAPLWLMHRYNYARVEDSKAQVAIYQPSIQELLFAAGFALYPLLLLPALCWLALMTVGLTSYGLGQYFYRHIGGYTGDCLGASQQVTEVIFYLTMSSVWTFI
jgi:adenosylcobinamide-GDP ribazoletransferase